MDEDKIKQFIAETEKVTLDVRASMKQGLDPFRIIMSAVGKLREGNIFHLINGFEPRPLYSVMRKRGYDHYTEKVDGVYNVYFFKSDEVQRKRDESEKNQPKFIPPKRVVEIDVRGMEPPQPMMTILAKLEELDGESMLLVHHHREPMMLYDKLEEIGWEGFANKIEEDYYKVMITKKAK
ncbi:MAG: DUF2249 domain-containing protein [Ignavibacteriales bacterium]|nr:MAG: DUF2249 domain-containing protein [Ignavibacteriaceae bacterium]MBW7872085.1 DUF2249 domain-containing protein [Ignavibacteria bacterium]MCZ2143719.1 DUF2249 domain-containing protein [Ignavibacteriales bacterium]OQY77560.1 MAG: hypothetical protein B6D45_02740 [Ignavibacteriales bacterium UTCHB3]MBV6446018.1 hypothetical protein [Ignavibacteriaceae bacterium]